MEGSHEAPDDFENLYYYPLLMELDQLRPLSPSRCIYRVPERLRHGHETAYTPQVVSIGPLHHGKEALRAMEEHKKRYLRSFLNRTQVSCLDYIKKIRDQEARLRSYYAEPIEFNSDEFVTIVLVDAAFIIEYLLRYCFESFRDENDCIFGKPWMRFEVCPDLQMLENQLPFFILEDLYDPAIIFHHTVQERSLINLSYIVFNTAMSMEGTRYDLGRDMSKSQVEVLHFVDFIRILCLPLPAVPESKAVGQFRTLNIPSITELHQAGVKFRVARSKNLFNIKFKDGIIEIPKLEIIDSTEVTIRNVVALEQCHYIDKYVSDYVSIMSGFVNTPMDLEFLVRYGIVENSVGDSRRVSTLINSLANRVIVNGSKLFYFAALLEDLNNFCKTPWHRWMANLKKSYQLTPMEITFVIILPLFALWLSLIQTTFSFVSFYTATASHGRVE